jgi:hypothetical protein
MVNGACYMTPSMIPTIDRTLVAWIIVLLLRIPTINRTVVAWFIVLLLQDSVKDTYIR